MTRRVKKMNLFYAMKEDALNLVYSFFLFSGRFFSFSDDDGIVFAQKFHKRCEVYVEVEAENSSGRY